MYVYKVIDLQLGESFRHLIAMLDPLLPTFALLAVVAFITGLDPLPLCWRGLHTAPVDPAAAAIAVEPVQFLFIVFAAVALDYRQGVLLAVEHYGEFKGFERLFDA